MPFMFEKIEGGNFEVLMKGGTLRGRVNYPKNTDRRFALCAHENDAEVITDALNKCEQLGIL